MKLGNPRARSSPAPGTTTGSTPIRSRANRCWNSKGKKRSSSAETTDVAPGQAVNVQGSRNGRCDCSPFGVAVPRTSGGTSSNM